MCLRLSQFREPLADSEQNLNTKKACYLLRSIPTRRRQGKEKGRRLNSLLSPAPPHTHRAQGPLIPIQQRLSLRRIPGHTHVFACLPERGRPSLPARDSSGDSRGIRTILFRRSIIQLGHRTTFNTCLLSRPTCTKLALGQRVNAQTYTHTRAYTRVSISVCIRSNQYPI